MAICKSGQIVVQSKHSFKQLKIRIFNSIKYKCDNQVFIIQANKSDFCFCKKNNQYAIAPDPQNHPLIKKFEMIFITIKLMAANYFFKKPALLRF